MTIKETKLIGEPVLRETAEKVADFKTIWLKECINDLIDTMRSSELAGIAAPQIGLAKRLFVSEIRETRFRSGEVDDLRVYINPEIIEVSSETELGWEGCGSVPGLFGKVERPKRITLRYMDENRVSREISASGLLARVIQHEIDHLNGVLFTDLADPMTFVSRDYYLQNIRGKS